MPSRVSRRDFGKTAAFAAATPPPQKDAPEMKYAGALDGLETKVDIAGFDTAQWTRKRHASAPLKLTYAGGTQKQTEAWQKKLRGKVTELLGGFPKTKAPLNPQTLEVKEFPTYQRQKFVIQTQAGLYLLGYLLLPKKGSAPFPTMICVPGHGRGVDDIVGIDEKGRDRADKPGYQHDFALQAVEHGLAAVAIEPMGFGCRRDAAARKGGLGRSSCQPSAGAALLLGETMIGWRVYDVMRTVDWIETRSGLDAKRVGVMGISGGGTITTFSAALEPRIKAAFVSGYMNTFRDSILSLSHCIDNYVPGILNHAEMYDVAGLIAPKPLFVESGDKDNIFPVDSSRESVARVRKVYEAFEAGDKVGHEVFAGEHSFNGNQGLPFMAKHL